MQTAKRSGIFLDHLCIVSPPAAKAAMTSQVLTNLVFLVRRKDQPLDKSVFIRKEEKPSSIFQPCLGHYSLSFSLKPAFLSPNIRHPSWLVSLIVSVEDQSSKLHANSPSRWLIKRMKDLFFAWMPKATWYIKLTLAQLHCCTKKFLKKKNDNLFSNLSLLNNELNVKQL